MFSFSWGYFIEVSNVPILKRKHSSKECFAGGLHIFDQEPAFHSSPTTTWLPTFTNKASLDHAGDDGQVGRFHTCLCGDSKTVQITTRILFSRVKLTRTSQLSALSFTNRKDSWLILLLLSRKEKRAHPSKPCWASPPAHLSWAK